MVALAEPPRLIEIPRVSNSRWALRLLAVCGLPLVIGAVGLAAASMAIKTWWRIVRDPVRAVEAKRGKVVARLICGELKTLRGRIACLAAGETPRPCDREIVTLMANKVLIDMETE